MLAVSLIRSFGGFLVLAVERGEPVHWSAKLVAIYVREACARSLLALISPLGWGGGHNPVADGASEDARRVPLILVPDDQRNRSSLTFLRTFLVNRGWKWAWAVNHERGDKSLDERAQDLAGQVAMLARTTGVDAVDIVGHGTGGLVAAWYVRHLGGDAHVRRLVTLGTPWCGTRMAVFRTDRTGAQILHGAAVLDELSPPPVQTVCVWSPDDPSIVPPTSAVAGQGAESVRVEAAGHDEMLVSARVFRTVQAALT